MKQYLLIVCIATTSLLTGCVSSYVKPIQPETKPIAIEDGKALIVAFWGTLAPMGKGVFLLEDKKPVAYIDRRTKTFYQASPGKHTYALGTDNDLPFGGFDFLFIDAEIEAGKVYYISALASQPQGISFTGSQISATNPTMEDNVNGGVGGGILPFLKFFKPYVMSDVALKYFNDEKDDLLPRYDEQYTDWKKLDESKRIKLRPSGLKPSEVSLHNGKYM
ncbi:MAG: hypothetical protein Q9M44_01230 [Ghiorsea sp.]|nr:hypothetical protein [Ghiorsea sp.]